MSRKNVNFNDKKNKKCDFYKNKRVIKIDDIGVNEILVSKEESWYEEFIQIPLCNKTSTNDWQC